MRRFWSWGLVARAAMLRARSGACIAITVHAAALRRCQKGAARWPHKQLVASSTRKPPYRHQYEHDYSSISHVCRPMSAILNRKPEQEWYREKKESDVT